MNVPHGENRSTVTEGTASDPYVEARAMPGTSAQPVRPTGIAVLGVLCTIAGLLALLSSMGGLVNLLFGQQFAAMFTQNGPFAEAQAEMNEKMAAVLAKYLIPNLLIAVAGLVLGGFFLTGGVAVLLGKAWSRTLLRRTLLLAIVYEIFRTVIYGFTQFEVMPITQGYMEQVAGGGDGEMIAQMSSVMMIVGFVFWGLWTLAKLALMAWGRSYLGKPHLDSYFAGSA